MSHIGIHIAKESTLTKTIQSALDTGVSCIQCFLGPPVQYNTKTFDSEDLKKSGELLEDHDIKLYIHAPYVINLANLEVQEKGIKSLQKILTTLASVSKTHTGTVLHIGANGSLNNVAEAINSMDICSPLLLENCAGEGSKLGKTMADLHKLIELINSPLVGICIDTCHAHSSGMTDMRSVGSVVKLFEDLPHNRQTMFHLNDSKVGYEAKVDRHMPIGDGTIWLTEKESLHEFIRLSKDTERDIILETPTVGLNELLYFI